MPHSAMLWKQMNASMNFLMLHVDVTTVEVWKLGPKNVILKVFNEFSFSQNV
jgi:hypothetical protein